MSKREHPISSGPQRSSPSTAMGFSHTRPPTLEEAEAGDFATVTTKEDKRKQRKMEKQKPQFQFDTSYFRLGKKIGIAHVRDMLLYIVADAQRPQWIVPEHKSKIAHTVVLFAPGLVPEHLGIEPVPITANLPFPTAPTANRVSQVPTIAQLFTYACPTRAPGDQRRLFSAQATLLQSPLPDEVRRRKEENSKKLAKAASVNAASPLIYLLTPNQMLDCDYRLPSYITPSDKRQIPGIDMNRLSPQLELLLNQGAVNSDTTDTQVVPDSYQMTHRSNGSTADVGPDGRISDEGWVETPEAKGQPFGGVYPVLAMDCEMVVTEDGQELARVSVIDFNSGVDIFDEFVQPPKPVLDYRTQWSGITPEKLKNATHTVASIQDALLKGPTPIITPYTVLLGHSLECDLTALKIKHPLCVDTAIIYKHPRGPPYKPGLKWLAQKWMGKEIQGGEHGHDSEEDARACVDLLKLKLANGPDFGSFLDSNESIFERMNRFVVDKETKKHRTTACCDYGNPRAGHGQRATTVEKCTSDDEVITAMIKHVNSHDFVFGKLAELHGAQGWNAGPKAEALPDPSDNGSSSSEESDEGATQTKAIQEALSKFDERVQKLHAALPGNTAFIILTGHGNPLPMMELSAKRQKWERLVKTLGGFEAVPKEERWLSENDRELEVRAAEAREGMSFFCVKRA